MNNAVGMRASEMCVCVSAQHGEGKAAISKESVHTSRTMKLYYILQNKPGLHVRGLEHIWPCSICTSDYHNTGAM